MKHTPGPWRIEYDENIFFESDAAKSSIAMLLTDHWPPDDTYFANARLIAAAPLMLEALKTIIERYREDGTFASPKGKESLDTARAAIAAATEEE